MSKYFQLIFLLILTLIFNQCSDDIDLQFHDYKSENVINSFLRNDSVVFLTLSKSGHINSGEILRVEDAKIALFQNDLFFDSLYDSGNGIYNSRKKLSVNADYRVSVLTENKIIEAYDYLPEKPTIMSIKRKDNAGINADTYYGTVEVELYDKNQQQEYYEIEIIYLSIEGEREYPLYPRSNTDKVVLNENLPSYAGFEPFPFSDELFNGDTIKIIFEYYTPRLISNGIEQEIDPDYFLIVKLRKTSKDYYLFRKSVINHFESQQPDFWNGIGNQINIHSNVEGGLGIFAGYSEIIDTLYYNKK